MSFNQNGGCWKNKDGLRVTFKVVVDRQGDLLDPTPILLMATVSSHYLCFLGDGKGLEHCQWKVLNQMTSLVSTILFPFIWVDNLNMEEVLRPQKGLSYF